MTDNERRSTIAQLAFVEGVNESVFQNYTDEQLVERMNLHYGEDYSK